MNVSEFHLINKIKQWINNKGLIIDVGDDAAAFKLKPELLTLFTTDSLVENIHFNLGALSPKDLGYKSLAVNISDIAAMGGGAQYATVSLGIPGYIDLAFIKNFYKGLNQVAAQFKTKIVGGDLTTASELFISISLIGQVAKDKILKRSTAKPGDVILVTGSLGKAAALNYQIKPTPKIKEAQSAAKLGVKTAIDVSDGLVSDCQKICEASRVGCQIFADKVPVDRKATKFAKSAKIDTLNLALSGGEDYQLIFTASKNLSSKLIKIFKTNGWPLAIIGEITKRKSIQVFNKNGKLIKWEKGYEHKFSD